MKDELAGKIMTEFAALRPKTCNYLTDDNDEIKKAKGTRKSVIKRNLKFEDYKNCLEANQFKKEIIIHKEFIIKNNKLKSKSQQRFRVGNYNVFTEEVDKIALSANNDKRIQSIDSIETYAYGRSKDIVYRKEEIKCNNIIKQYKND